MNPNTLVFRADANPQIGTGHIMRCYALAKAAQNEGFAVHFVVRNLLDGLAARFCSEGFNLHQIRSVPGSDDDAAQLVALMHKLKADCCVVDGYHFGTAYQYLIKQANRRLMVIDDYGHAEHYWADVVLNQNIQAEASLYKRREQYTQLLLGSQYVLLRPEFLAWRGWQRDFAPVTTKLMVTLGGSDPDNQTQKVVTALQRLNEPDLSVIVVVGAGYRDLDALAHQISNSPQIRWVQNATNMPDLMAWADIAVSGGGSTCWELAFMGLPALVVILADNQEPVARGLASVGCAVNLGWACQLDSAYLADNLILSSRSIERRREMSLMGRQLVDGFGTKRVLAKFLE